MYFEINTAQARQEAADLQRLAGSIDLNVFYISALYVSLRLVGAPSIQYVVKRVQKQNAALAQESRRLRAMGTSLNKIAGYYDNADSSVASKRAVTGSVLNDVFYKRNNGASNTEMDELINRFEKEHPEYAEKFDNLIASDKKKMLTEDDIRRIKYLAYTAEEPYRTIYLETLERYTIGDSNMAEGAYYRSWYHDINFTYDECFGRDPRGPYTTFFHESGHGIDDLADLSKEMGDDTDEFKGHNDGKGRDVTIREAIEYDVYYNKNNPHSVTSLAKDIINKGKSGSKGNIDNVIEAFKKGSPDGLNKNDRALYNAVRNAHQNETGRGPSMEAVTDVYGGASKNALQNYKKSRMGYTHDDDYWNDQNNTSRELWAEYFSYHMAGDKEALNNLREYFPEAADILEQYAKELATR